MSFQDVGKRNSSRQPVNATMMGSNGNGNTGNSSALLSAAKRASSSASVFASMSIPAATVTTQISDSITQYHRNVGILEKIAHALLTPNNGGRNRNELEQQYKAQSDVLRELELRLKDVILGQRQRLSSQSNQTSSTHKQTLMKLERDFERVQTSVQVTKSKVTKQMKQYQQRNTSSASAAARRDQESNSHINNNTQTVLQQQQIQIQQDRLQEEIMREREDEIRAINKGMHQVNEIYKDLAHIVGEQQEDVDQIENKMEESKTAAQSGYEQVSKANEKYGGSGNPACIIS